MFFWNCFIQIESGWNSCGNLIRNGFLIKMSALVWFLSGVTSFMGTTMFKPSCWHHLAWNPWSSISFCSSAPRVQLAESHSGWLGHCPYLSQQQKQEAVWTIWPLVSLHPNPTWLLTCGSWTPVCLLPLNLWYPDPAWLYQIVVLISSCLLSLTQLDSGSWLMDLISC